LLEAGRDEEFIEKDTGVSDRTIRRWKMELERTGRIGKPPESRTGRHRVLNAEVETVSTPPVVARGLGSYQCGRVS
jgi:transposase